ncbi:hypothetical protein D3C85_1373080 [compost metagenome]
MATACSWNAPLVGTKPILPSHCGSAKSITEGGRSFSSITLGLKATTRVRAVTPIQLPLAATYSLGRTCRVESSILASRPSSPRLFSGGDSSV